MNTQKEIAQNFVAAGVMRTQLPLLKMLMLGIFAGIFIALGGVGMIMASSTITTPSLGRLLGAAVFPAGLVMVVMTGGELFTGNSMIIIPVLEKQVTIGAMLKNWLIVYTGNFIGALLVALVTVYGGTFSSFDNAAAAALINTAAAKTALTFGEAFLRAIPCNFLVCIAIWAAFASKSSAGKIIGLYMPIMLFVLSGYEHSVANMFFLPAGLMASLNDAYLSSAGLSAAGQDTLAWSNMLTRNLIPVTLGNVAGGVLFVGAAYWYIYQRVPGKK